MTAPVIEAHGVRKRFGDVQALDGLDLVAESGRVTALLGPNGAGKTTFVSALATLIEPDEGDLRVIDVLAEPRRARQVIGLAGQAASVEPTMTGRENIEWVARLYGLSKREARAAAGEVLERMGLTDAAGRLVRTYSGGMRRRLDLGASLVGHPQLLLLDEPTTGLDPPQPRRALGRHPRPRRRRNRRAAHHPVPGRGRPDHEGILHRLARRLHRPTRPMVAVGPPHRAPPPTRRSATPAPSPSQTPSHPFDQARVSR